MPSYRCTMCGIHYPVEMRFQKCPVHGDKTSYITNSEPDDDWDWKATYLKARARESDMNDATIPVLAVEVVVGKGGHCFIAAEAVKALGLTRALLVEDVIEIPTAESQHRRDDEPCDALWEVQGFSVGLNAYWIRPLRVPDTVGD